MTVAKSVFKKHKGIGPGGIDCPCCTDLNSRKKNTKRFNKRFRAKTKQELKNV